MPARNKLAASFGKKSAVQVLASPSTVAYDFGTPDDVNLGDYNPGDRILIVWAANRASGTTSTLQLVVQDATGTATTINTGSLATALVDTTPAVIAAGDAGLSVRYVSVVKQAGRNWLRISATHVGGTDSFQSSVHVLGIPAVS